MVCTPWGAILPSKRVLLSCEQPVYIRSLSINKKEPPHQPFRLGAPPILRGVARMSAGLLPYRRGERELEVLIAHMGGPFWARKDEGAWSIVKGEHGPDE